MRKMMISTASLVAALGLSPAVAAQDVTKTLTDIEAKWALAAIAHDNAFVDAIMASDWTGQNPSGVRMTKAMFLADKDSHVSTMVNHDVFVRKLGDIAIVQGMDDETSSYKSKDTSGTYSWTDVFQMRAGKWVAISSQVTKVDK